MRNPRVFAALAVALALLAMSGRVVASGWHHHDDDRNHAPSCSVCDAVHMPGTAGDAPDGPPAPVAASWPLVLGHSADAVIFGITALNSRGPPSGDSDGSTASVS